MSAENQPQPKKVETKDVLRWSLEAGVVALAIGWGGLVRLIGIAGGVFIGYKEIQNRRKK